MPFDFPASPTNGQQVTGANGVVWIWDGVKWVASTAGAVLPSAQTNVGRNLCHNSLFTIAQRGVGPFTGVAPGYGLDRWRSSASTSTFSLTQIALSDADRAAIGDEAAKYGLQSVCTGTAGAGDYVQAASQPIEDVMRLSGKTVTVSFWAKATVGTPKIGLELFQSFGVGGSPSATVTGVGSQSFTLSTTWARYPATIVLPSAAGKTLGTSGDLTSITFWQSSGATLNARAGGIGVQSYTLQLWGVQLEIGSVVTPLEKRDPELELRQCQRFYQVGTMQYNSYQQAAGSIAISNHLPVPMRALPAIAPTITGTSNVTGATMGAISNAVINISGTATALGGFTLYGNYTASADL